MNGGGITIGNTYATSGFTFGTNTSFGLTNAAALTVPNSFALTTALTKSGVGYATLTGTNSFSGAAITGGGLQLNSAAALTVPGRTIVATGSSAFSYNYSTPLQPLLICQVDGLSTGSLALSSLNNAAENLDFSAASGANQTGLILGALTGNSISYTGTITPNAGIYRLGGGGGTLTLPNTNALTGSNSLVFNSPVGGDVVLPVTNNFTGGTTLAGGTNTYNLIFSNGSLGSGPITFTGASTLRWAAGNTQDISASRTVTTGNTSVFDTNGNNVVFSSPIGNFGAGQVTKAGTGNLTLTGINTYTGQTNITGGTLILANGALINSNVNLTVANSLVLAGTSATVGGLIGSVGESLLAGSTLTIGANNSGQTYSGALAATTAGITKIGAATQALSGANLYTGVTTVQMGNLTSGQLVSSNLNLVFAASNLTNRIAATSALVLGGSIATDAQTVLGGGTLTLTGAASITNSQTVPSITIGVGGNNIVLAANATANPLLLTTGATAAASALVRNVGGTLHLTQPTGTLSATNGFATLNGTASTILTSATGTAYATIGANAAGAYDWAGKDSTNAWVAPVTYLTAGTNVLYATSTAASNTDVTAAYTATGATTVGTLRFNNAAVANTHNLGGFITTVDKGGVLFGGTAVQTVSAGTLKPGAGNELVFINTNTGTPAISAVLADGAGASSVTYRALIGATATGQFSVTGTNTYTGPTYITSGRVATSAVAQPFGTGANAKVYIDGNTNGQWFAAGTATVANPFLITGNGWSESGGPFGAIRIDSAITLTGGITLLGDAAIGVNTGTGTISGPISGAFNLTKVAALILNLTGTNTLTGKYVASGGQLTFGSAGAYGPATGIALTGGAVGLNAITGIQANIINRLTPLNAATPLNGTVGVSATTVAENVDFNSATLDMSNVYFGSVAAGLTYTGTITPYKDAYKIGGGGNLMTFSNTNAFVDNGLIPRSVTTRNNTVILTGTNTYSGGTTASAVLQFANGSLGSGPITLSGGTLAWAIGGNTQDVTAGGRVVTLAGNANTLDTFGNNVTLSGPLALNTTNATTKAGGGTLTLTGNSTTTVTSPTFTNSVAGLTLGTANALPVYTNLNNALTAGVITTITANQTVGSLGGTGTLSAATFAIGSNTLTFGYNNANPGVDSVFTGSGSLIKVGTGSQFFRVQSPGYTGGLTVNNGFLILEFAQIAANLNNILATGTNVSLGGGALYLLGKDAASTNTQTLTSNITLNPGASTVATQPRVTGTPTLVFALNGFTRNPGATVNVYPIGSGTSFTPTFGTLGSVTTSQSNTDYTAAGGNQSILAGYAAFSGASGATTPTTWAVSSNAAANTAITGLAAFSGTYTAGTNVDSALGNVSTGAAALAINSLRFNTAGAYTLDASSGLSIASGGILATGTVGANPISILNGTLTSGNGTDLIIHHYTTGDITIGSQITGGIGLTKSGAGRLILTNAANSYNGGTFVNAGTLRYGVSVTPSSTAALIHSGGTIELIDGVTVTGQTATVSGTGVGGNGALFGATGTSTWAGNVVIGDIETRIGAANVATLNITGVISDGAATNGVLNNKLWINGAGPTGTIVLSGTNTYSGTTAVIRGYLKLGSAGALPGTTTLDVHSGGNNLGTTVDQATVDLNGFSYAIAGLARTDALGTSFITNNAATTSTLTLNNAAANTYSGSITDGLGKIAFVKSGAGNLTLSGSNTFSGGLTINGGTLRMGSNNAIGSQANPNALTMTGGTLDSVGIAEINVTALNGAAGTITDSGTTAGTTALSTSGTGTSSFGGLIADGPVRAISYIKTGSGTQAFTNAGNTYSGVTAVCNGILQVSTIAAAGAPQSLGTGTSAILLGMGSTTGTLEYTGVPAGDLQRNITVGGAGAVIKNSSANTLTLSGTLNKNGNTITLTGTGNFIASGLINGVLPNSDLIIDGTTATLTNAANNYTGPTRVINAGTVIPTSNGALGALAGAVFLNDVSTLKAGADISTSARTVTLGVGGGIIDTDGHVVTLDVGSTVTGTSLTKKGAGKLLIAGAQTYATLDTEAGRTDIASVLGTGTSSIIANAETNISVSQTLASLTIGDGAVVTLGSPLPPAPAAADAGGALGLGLAFDSAPAIGAGALAGSDLASVQVQGVPEPGSATLLLGGMLTLLGLRRRPSKG